MLDYAANGVSYWPIEQLQSAFESECAREALSPEDKLSEFLAGRIDSQTFWKNVQVNLQNGRIRMVFLADEIPPELKRVIEFLNEQMDPAEVLGLEVKHFSSGTLRAIGPELIGRTSKAVIRKRPNLEVPRPGMQEAVEEFQRLSGGRYIVKGSAADYRQISLTGVPDGFHYEFLHRKDTGLTAEVHVEGCGFSLVKREMAALAAETPSINGGHVVFDGAWNGGRGARLRILQERKTDACLAAETMWELIAHTEARLMQACRATR